MRMTVREACEATGALLVAGDAEAEVTSVCIDSRQAREGSLFVAFAGQRVDGNRFVCGAAERGAAAVAMTEDPSPETIEALDGTGCAVLRIPEGDGEEFMLRLAAAWRRRNPQWEVVGVTGSVGKTTTKEMLATALATRYRVHATKGNFNNLLGVPLTLFAAPDDAEVLVVEMGMNHAGELTRLAHAALPNVAVITNVGTSHIGNLGSRENIARAKAEVVSGLTASGGRDPLLVLNADDDFCGFIEEGFARPAGVRVLRFGLGDTADVRGSDVTLDGEGRASLTASLPAAGQVRATLPVPGRHIAMDFLPALAIAWHLGCDPEAVAHAVEHMPQTHERLEVVQREGTPRVIDDSYNASPSSIAAALDVLCSMCCEGRRVAVLGEVAELGQEARRLHGYIGAYAAAKPLDLLVLIGGELIRETAEAARTMGLSEDRLEVFPDVDSALRTMAPVFGPQDLVLVKASRAAGLDQFAEGVLSR